MVQDIRKRLAENGTTAVKFGEISKYLSKRLEFFNSFFKIYKENLKFPNSKAAGNALKAALFYLSLNQETYKRNFYRYVSDELLGGLTGVCKQHTELFFQEIAQRKLWAIESNQI